MPEEFYIFIALDRGQRQAIAIEKDHVTPGIACARLPIEPSALWSPVQSVRERIDEVERPACIVYTLFR
jgi:hypothetical protein